MAITKEKIVTYQAQLLAGYKDQLGSKLSVATKPDAIRMWEAEAGGDGSVNKMSVFINWIQNCPLAMKFFTTPSVAEANFQKIISGAVTFTTAADALPSTYIALHAENTANEPKLAGLLALRSLGVDSTFKDDGANLEAGSAGNTLTDSYVMGLYTTWGATKFNAVFNKNILTTLFNETNTNYQTLSQLAATYSGWNHTAVSVKAFFTALDKLVGAGVTSLKFSDLLSVADSAANFKLYTSDAVVALMASNGGSWSTITGLPAQTLSDLTSPNAIKAIKQCGADYTKLSTVYAADHTKYAAMISDNSIALASKGYTGVDFNALSTVYGTTYTLANNARFLKIINPANDDLIKNGVTLAHIGAAVDAGRLKSFTQDIKTLIEMDTVDCDAIFNDLVLVNSSTSHYGGLETLGGI